MGKLVVVPCTSYVGETATAYPLSIGEYVPGQEGITLDQFLQLSGDAADAAREMTPKERYQFMCEDLCYYTFDQLVVIDEEHLPKLEELSAKALDHGSDSAWYEACQWYNECMRNMGEKTIDFFNPDVIVAWDY